jgi:hypothetical protein
MDIISPLHSSTASCCRNQTRTLIEWRRLNTA